MASPVSVTITSIPQQICLQGASTFDSIVSVTSTVGLSQGQVITAGNRASKYQIVAVLDGTRLACLQAYDTTTPNASDMTPIHQFLTPADFVVGGVCPGWAQ